MKISKTKLALMSAGLSILCLCAIVFFYYQGKSDAVDPLIAEQSAGYQVATVRVTADGFEPEHIELLPGVPTKINFKKSTSFTCIKNMISKELGMDIPLNKGDNIVTLEAMQPGTLEYHCGMYMYYGTISVKDIKSMS
ncbi:cupredoxin domain-containing protein [Paenibacillus sp. UNC451MF]|uniref:cupredoxin domain-containing protein n=1 Tax=Paenibacillus sp. UNC451MF TaxID=1449063 RepID=UPI00048BAEAA|nr:cupredoxin domain-containing protein [Paenibacillus sp. UNC451MF]